MNKNVIKVVQSKLDSLTKPRGSLGFLEELIIKIGDIQNTTKPNVNKKKIFIFAGDHGIAKRGVSAYPPEVTRQMILNFASGGAAINVLTKKFGIDLGVVDVGVCGFFDKSLPILHKKIADGTKDFLREDAMTLIQMNRAIEVGRKLAFSHRKFGVLGVGEMGIGNTTSASAITASLLGISVPLVTGRGTGIDDNALENKISVIRQALDMRKINRNDPFDILKKVGGFEIAAIVGFSLGCANYKVPLVTDGFIATAGVALACAVDKNVSNIIFGSHFSKEGGHKYLLDYLNIKAPLDLSMRLGEGTGAAIMMNIMDTALSLYNDMATFTSAGVSEKI